MVNIPALEPVETVYGVVWPVNAPSAILSRGIVKVGVLFCCCFALSSLGHFSFPFG